MAPYFTASQVRLTRCVARLTKLTGLTNQVMASYFSASQVRLTMFDLTDGPGDGRLFHRFSGPSQHDE